MDKPIKSKIKRPYGHGSIWNRGGTYYVRYAEGGKEHLFSLHTANEREAHRRADEHLAPLLASRSFTVKSTEKLAAHVVEARRGIDAGRVSVAGAWDSFAGSHRRNTCLPSTLENYKSYWMRFATWMANNRPEVKDIGQIDKNHADAYATDLWGAGTSARTFNAHLQGLRMVCRSIGVGLDGNPFGSAKQNEDGIKKKPQDDPRERAPFTKDEAWKIIEKLSALDAAVIDREETRVLWVVGICTGLRLADAVSLKWSSVDIKRNVVKVTPQKTRTRRPERCKGKAPTATIPMHPFLFQALEEARAWKNESGYVLPVSAEKFNRDRKLIDRNVIRVLDMADLKATTQGDRGISRRKYGYHSCRHYFCTECVAGGISLSKLADMTGDDPKTLSTFYIDIDERADKDVIASLAVSPEDRARELLIAGLTDRLREMPLPDLKKLCCIDELQHAVKALQK